MMQGDSYNLGITILNNAGKSVTPEDVIDLEITIGHLTKTYLAGELIYAQGKWFFPFTQKETFSFRPGVPKWQVRVKWINGIVEGKTGFGARITESRSREVL